MKRASSRLSVVLVMAVFMSVSFVGRAWAPRSWTLPTLSASCSVAGAPDTFLGAVDLNRVVVVNGVATVGGSVAGRCGDVQVNSFFRTAIDVTDASCTHVKLVLADFSVGGVQINLSEDPIPVSLVDVGRGPLCRLAATQQASVMAHAKAIEKVLSYLA